MLKLIQRPSAVRKFPTMGLTATFIAGESSGSGENVSPVSIELVTLSAMAQMPTPSRETSTTAGSPVRSRPNNAPAMPPAMVIPPIESPYAPAGIPIGRGLSAGVALHAAPLRHQNDGWS
jgi:hypothetical protein